MADTWLQILVRVKDRDYISIRDKITSGAELDYRHARRASMQIDNLIDGLVSGTHTGNLYLTISEHAANMFGATGTITCVVGGAAGKKVTFTILGKAIDLIEGRDFDRGGTNDTLAQALLAAIKASNAGGYYFAEILPAPANVVQLTPRYPAGLAPTPVITTDNAPSFAIVAPGAGTAPTLTSAALVHLLTNLEPSA
jgi:hypothetical protein